MAIVVGGIAVWLRIWQTTSPTKVTRRVCLILDVDQLQRRKFDRQTLFAGRQSGNEGVFSFVEKDRSFSGTTGKPLIDLLFRELGQRAALTGYETSN